MHCHVLVPESSLGHASQNFPQPLPMEQQHCLIVIGSIRAAEHLPVKVKCSYRIVHTQIEINFGYLLYKLNFIVFSL